MGTPDHSRALIPNTEAKKERGRNMMVKIVNIMTARDCSAARSDCSRARWTSKMLACFCFMSRSFSYCVAVRSVYWV